MSYTYSVLWTKLLTQNSNSGHVEWIPSTLKVIHQRLWHRSSKQEGMWWTMTTKEALTWYIFSTSWWNFQSSEQWTDGGIFFDLCSNAYCARRTSRVGSSSLTTCSSLWIWSCWGLSDFRTTYIQAGQFLGAGHPSGQRNLHVRTSCISMLHAIFLTPGDLIGILKRKNTFYTMRHHSVWLHMTSECKRQWNIFAVSGTDLNCALKVWFNALQLLHH